MRHISTLLFLLPLALAAQITHTVSVVGSLGGANPAYQPADITIEQGDIINWICAEGTHNVYGNLDSFPNNPVPFFNSMTALASPWTYSFTFNVQGFYNYGCNGGTQLSPHWDIQQGTVTVVAASSIAENDAWGKVIVYPVPAQHTLIVEMEDVALSTIDVIGSDGRVVYSTRANAVNKHYVDLRSLKAGTYNARLTDEKGRVLIRPFVKLPL